MQYRGLGDHMHFNLEDLELSIPNILQAKPNLLSLRINAQTAPTFLVVKNLKLKNVRANYNSIQMAYLPMSPCDFELQLPSWFSKEWKWSRRNFFLKLRYNLHIQKAMQPPRILLGPNFGNIDFSCLILFLATISSSKIIFPIPHPIKRTVDQFQP